MMNNGSSIVRAAQWIRRIARLIVSVCGVLIAWRRERAGGAILVLCGLALSVFAYFSAGHNKAFAILVSGVPFFVPGVLFLLSWWMSRNESQT